jgi:HEAT repeat protein
LSGQHGAKSKQDAAFVLVSEDLNWREQQIVRLLKLGSRADEYDASWDAICRRAGELKLADAVDPLIAILRRRPSDGEAALALGEIGDRRAIPVLLKTIESNGHIQEFHIYALRDLGAPALPDILIRHLDDYKCVDMLGDLNAKEAIEPLKKTLSTSKDEYLNSKIRLTLVRLNATDRKDLAEQLIQIAETAKTSEERWSAIQHVSATGQRWTIARLLKIAKTSADSSVVYSAIEAIGELGGDEAVAGLISLFDHDFSHALQFSKLPDDKNSTNYDVFISLALKAATGDDLGNDVQAWHRYPK